MTLAGALIKASDESTGDCPICGMARGFAWILADENGNGHGYVDACDVCAKKFARELAEELAEETP